MPQIASKQCMAARRVAATSAHDSHSLGSDLYMPTYLFAARQSSTLLHILRICWAGGLKVTASINLDSLVKSSQSLPTAIMLPAQVYPQQIPYSATKMRSMLVAWHARACTPNECFNQYWQLPAQRLTLHQILKARSTSAYVNGSRDKQNVQPAVEITKFTSIAGANNPRKATEVRLLPALYLTIDPYIDQSAFVDASGAGRCLMHQTRARQNIRLNLARCLCH